MVCPFCLHKKTEVYNTRKNSRLNQLWRRRRCLACQRQFTTYESIGIEHIISVATDGRKPIPFSKAKLTLDLLRACDHRHDDAAYWLAETIAQKLIVLASAQEGMVSPEAITEACLVTLKPFDAAAFVKYLSYHSFASDASSLKRRLK
jgi:transcriptional repressor NrdR